MSGNLQLVQSSNSGSATYSHLIGTTHEINRNMYFCNKCAGESSRFHISHIAGTKQCFPAIVWSLKSALGQEKSKFRTAVPLDSHQLQRGPVLAGSPHEHWLHLNLQFTEKPITKTSPAY